MLFVVFAQGSVNRWIAFANEKQEVIPVSLIIRLKQKMSDKEICPIGCVLMCRKFTHSRETHFFAPAEGDFFNQLFEISCHDLKYSARGGIFEIGPRIFQNGDMSCPWMHLVISSMSVSNESCSMANSSRVIRYSTRFSLRVSIWVNK